MKKEFYSLLFVRAAPDPDIIVSLIRMETKASKSFWRVKDEKKKKKRGRKGSCHVPTLTPWGSFVERLVRKLTEGQGVGVGRGTEQLRARTEGGKKKAANNKLIRNGCKIALDERLAKNPEEKKKKKANH